MAKKDNNNRASCNVYQQNPKPEHIPVVIDLNAKLFTIQRAGGSVRPRSSSQGLRWKSTMPFLTTEQVSNFHNDGYLLLDNFWNSETVTDLKQRISEIVSGLNPNDSPHSLGFTKSIFTTKEDRRDADDYFLESGYAIRYFWEENAWVDGKLTRPPEVAINKIGHGLHDIDPKFQAVTYEARIGHICRDLGMSVPIAVQSMYIFKQALVGGEVCAHQGIMSKPTINMGMYYLYHMIQMWQFF